MSEVQIFQILGLVYFAAGLGMLINPEFFKKMLEKLTDCPLAIYLGAVLALIVGYLLITFYNVWRLDWVLIITVIGWFALLKGLFILIFPKAALKFASKVGEKWISAKGIIVAILGAVLIILGFFVL